MFHGSQSFHAVPVHLPDVRSTYLGGGRPTPFQGNPFGLIMAGAALAAVPIIIIFLIFQKYFTKGIAMGAVKG